jgi:hypothetical protein
MTGMNISKAHWASNGNDLRMSMPITKIDVERRIVSGWATLDNLDRQGDVVDAEASVKAFSSFRNNLREMHQPIAVGKVVSFKPEKYYDQETGRFYNGIIVSAYVSKGAQDTWEKVLDGTLTGFSIGGEIHDAEKVYDEELGKAYQVIKDYSLSELSLVDNPANQHANVISIEKGLSSGYLSKALIENVFWCSEDDLVQLSSGNTSDCPRCDKGMANIGFVETNDAEKAEVVKSILSTVKNDVREVSKMDNEVIEETAPVEEVEKSAETVDEVAEEVVEKSEDENSEVAEVEKVDDAEGEDDEEDDEDVMKSETVVEDAVNEQAAMMEAIKSIAESTHSAMDTLADTIKSLNEKVEELNKAVSGVKQEVDSVKDEFGKRVDAVEKDTAFRKSGDLGEVVQEPIVIEKAQNKSLWGGRFLTKSDLFS